MNDKKEDSLLDYLCKKSGDIFISDIRYNSGNKERVVQIINETDVDRFSREDWIDACLYITDKKANTSKEAKEILGKML